MSIHPTRTAATLAVAGLVAMAVGIALEAPNVVAWAGALVVGVAFARAVTLLSVLRIRSAGFEMIWCEPERAVRVTRGESIVLRAEIRNRDTLAARFDRLRVIASPALECEVDPPAGEVKATGSVEVRVTVRARRAGVHGVHGLALEVRGAPGLFEVPLTFANPFGVECVPRPAGRGLASPQGGRGRTLPMARRSSGRRGDGSELRELREIVPGDSFRRIAWKASARRGKLLARELERDERDRILLVLDASVELWSGPMGRAPLDGSIDRTCALAERHLAEGDEVGLAVVASRELARVPCAGGRSHLAAIARSLLDATSVLDWDRSGWDEAELAVQVAEHLRPHDPSSLRDLRRGRTERLAERASAARIDAPFDRAVPLGRTETDRALRHYAACFGMSVPPRLEPEQEHTALTIVATLVGVARASRPRPSVVHVIAPPPPSSAIEALRRSVTMLRRRGIAIRWSLPSALDALAPTASVRAGGSATEAGVADAPLTAAVRAAMEIRTGVALRRGEAILRGLGITLARSNRRSDGYVTASSTGGMP